MSRHALSTEKYQNTNTWEDFMRMKLEDGSTEAICEYCNKQLTADCIVTTGDLGQQLERHNQGMASIREIFRQKETSVASPESDLECAKVANGSLHCSEMASQVKPIAEKP